MRTSSRIVRAVLLRLYPSSLLCPYELVALGCSHCRAEIEWPDDLEITDEAKDFVEKLLTFDESERLGTAGAAEVRRHHRQRSQL